MTKLEAFRDRLAADLLEIRATTANDLVMTTKARIERHLRALVDELDVGHYGVEAYMSGPDDGR